MDDQIKSNLMEAYLAQQASLRRFLVARLANEQTAEDILQEMYLKLERSSFSTPVENLSAFLYRVANNLVLDYRKAAARRRVREQNWSDSQVSMAGTEPVQDEPNTDEAMDARRKLAQINAALEELPPQCRAVFKTCKFEGLTYREAAEKHDISIKTVEKHVSKALKYIMKFAPHRGNDP